ncbi:MAG: hypothetical protein FWF73_01650 [Spirochaetes bacterium]|nr:hypothetical protein [Spirochaetota bacterium]
MTVNKKYKDSVFRSIFNDKERLLELYNGKDSFPKEKFLRLSDLFKELDESDKNDYANLIFLDALVLMLNINKGCNPDLERRSRTLSGYAVFVAKVREYERKYNLEKAVKLAVEYCVKKGILTDYFKQNSSEEVSMNFIKYDEKIAIKVARKEAKEKGIIEGIEKGMEKGMEKGQSYVLKLMKQGLSYEEIEKKVEKESKKKHR